MAEYEQGSSPTFYATFVDHEGSAASILSGTITIRHRWGNTIIDVDNQLLIQLSESTYYYNWNIPVKSDKTIYDVRYIGSYSDGSVVVGTETFQVIPRKFFDKKGGGFVNRIVGRPTVWTIKEKKEIIEAIEGLLNRNNSSELLLIKQELKEIKKDKFEPEKIEKIFEGLSNQVKADFNFQKLEIIKYKELIEKFSKKEAKFSDKKIIEKISDLSKSIMLIDTDLKNERITRVIAEIEDLHKELKEFEEIFVKNMSFKAVEKIKNGN